MAEAKAKGEGETQCSNERTPPPPPSPNPNPNPRKRNNPKDLVPSLYNCHSCDRHVPPRRQTLTSLHPLDSEWRVVLLCDQCLCLIKSAAKCSYCFADFSACGGRGHRRLLDCRQCSCRIHFDCVPTQQRFALPALLKPESFVCVDCCALPNKKPRNFYTRVSVDELVKGTEEKAKAASKAMEKDLEKVRAAERANKQAGEALDAVSVRTIDPAHPAVKDDELVALKKMDEELALKLHLAMNGSHRIWRSGRQSMSSARSVEAKRGRQRNGCFEKIEFCMEDKGFPDSSKSSVQLGAFEKKGAKKETVGCSSSRPVEIVAKEEQGSYSDKDNITLTGWIAFQRASKSKGVGSREKFSEKKEMLNGIGAGENSCELKRTSRCDPPDRYAKKYIKRKSTLKEVSDGEMDAGR